MSKKEMQFFSLRVMSYRFNKSWPKIKIFQARERSWFQGHFNLHIKTHQLLEIPPLIIFSGGFAMVRRWRSNADLDLLLLPT